MIGTLRVPDLPAGTFLWLGEATVDENLSIEEYLFTQLRQPGPIFLLYVNKPAVVVGKHQNPWYEAAVEVLFQEGVPVRRRKSGGGAVYHDEGNLNYSFIMPKNSFHQTRNLKFLASAIEMLGIPVDITSGGDLFTQGLKFSGNALWYRRDRVLHHGCILIDTNLKKLSMALHGFRQNAVAELEGRWVDSKLATVVNLSQIRREANLASVRQLVSELWLQGFPGGTLISKEMLDLQQMKQTEPWKKIFQAYQSWEWNFGRTNAFTCIYRDIPQAILQIEEGYVRSLTITDNKGQRSMELPTAWKFRGMQNMPAVRNELRSVMSGL